MVAKANERAPLAAMFLLANTAAAILTVFKDGGGNGKVSTRNHETQLILTALTATINTPIIYINIVHI